MSNVSLSDDKLAWTIARREMRQSLDIVIGVAVGLGTMFVIEQWKPRSTALLTCLVLLAFACCAWAVARIFSDVRAYPRYTYKRHLCPLRDKPADDSRYYQQHETTLKGKPGKSVHCKVCGYGRDLEGDSLFDSFTDHP